MTTTRIETIQELALATGLSTDTIRGGINAASLGDGAGGWCSNSDIASRKLLVATLRDKFGGAEEARNHLSDELFAQVYGIA